MDQPQLLLNHILTKTCKMEGSTIQMKKSRAQQQQIPQQQSSHQEAKWKGKSIIETKQTKKKQQKKQFELPAAEFDEYVEQDSGNRLEKDLQNKQTERRKVRGQNSQKNTKILGVYMHMVFVQIPSVQNPLGDGDKACHRLWCDVLRSILEIADSDSLSGQPQCVRWCKER